MLVVPESVTTFVTVSAPTANNPGDTVAFALTVRLPRTLPFPLSVWLLLRTSTAGVRALTSRVELVEDRIRFGLFEMTERPTRASVLPALIVVSPSYELVP